MSSNAPPTWLDLTEGRGDNHPDFVWDDGHAYSLVMPLIDIWPPDDAIWDALLGSAGAIG